MKPNNSTVRSHRLDPVRPGGERQQPRAMQSASPRDCALSPAGAWVRYEARERLLTRRTTARPLQPPRQPAPHTPVHHRHRHCDEAQRHSPGSRSMEDKHQWPLYEVFVRARGGLDPQARGRRLAWPPVRAWPIDHARSFSAPPKKAWRAFGWCRPTPSFASDPAETVPCSTGARQNLPSPDVL